MVSKKNDPLTLMQEWLQVDDDLDKLQEVFQAWKDQDVIPSPVEFLKVLAPLTGPRVYLPREARRLSLLFEMLEYYQVRWYLALKSIVFFHDDDFFLRILHADDEIDRYSEHFFLQHPVIKVRDCQNLLKDSLKRIDRILDLDNLKYSSRRSVTSFSSSKLMSLADLIMDSIKTTEYFKDRFLLDMFIAVFLTWYRHLKKEHERGYFKEKTDVHVRFCQALARSLLVHVTEVLNISIGMEHHVIAPLKLVALPFLNLTVEELEITLEQLMESRNPWVRKVALFKLISLHHVRHDATGEENARHLQAILGYLKSFDQVHQLTVLSNHEEMELISRLKIHVFSDLVKITPSQRKFLIKILNLAWKRPTNALKKIELLDLVDETTRLRVIKVLLKQYPDPREHPETWQHLVKMIGRLPHDTSLKLQASLMRRTHPLPLPLLATMTSTFLVATEKRGLVTPTMSEKISYKRCISALTSMIEAHFRECTTESDEKDDDCSHFHRAITELSENIVGFLMLLNEGEENAYCIEIGNKLINTGFPPCQARGLEIIRLWGTEEEMSSTFKNFKEASETEVVEEMLVFVENELIADEDLVAEFMTHVISLPDLHLALKGFEVFLESENCWVNTNGIAALMWNIYENQDSRTSTGSQNPFNEFLQEILQVLHEKDVIDALQEFLEFVKDKTEARNDILKRFSSVIMVPQLKALLKAAGMKGYSSKRKHELIEMFYRDVLNIEDYVPFQKWSRKEQYRHFISCWWSFWRGNEDFRSTKTEFFKDMRQHFREWQFTFNKDGYEQYLAPFVAVVVGSGTGYFNDPEYHVLIPVPPALQREDVSLDDVITFLEKYYGFNPSMIDLFLKIK